VTSLEIDGQVTEMARTNLQNAATGEVTVVHTDGANGYQARANYDRIIATAGIWDVPAAWTRQLMPRGILVAPLWLDGFEVSAALILQTDGSLYSTDNRLCGFIPLRGQAAGPEATLRIGSSGLLVHTSPQIDSAALQMLLSEDGEDSYLGAALESGDYWQGFLPYFVLHLPESFTLGRYQVTKDAAAYGITGHGFVLMTWGSACFVSTSARGTARSFGSADAVLAVQEAIAAWERDGRPGQTRLRLRLVSKDSHSFAVKRGKVYARNDHYLLAWMEIGGTHG
jgi:hypothetical protein